MPARAAKPEASAKGAAATASADALCTAADTARTARPEPEAPASARLPGAGQATAAAGARPLRLGSSRGPCHRRGTASGDPFQAAKADCEPSSVLE